MRDRVPLSWGTSRCNTITGGTRAGVCGSSDGAGLQASGGAREKET